MFLRPTLALTFIIAACGSSGTHQQANNRDDARRSRAVVAVSPARSAMAPNAVEAGYTVPVTAGGQDRTGCPTRLVSRAKEVEGRCDLAKINNALSMREEAVLNCYREAGGLTLQWSLSGSAQTPQGFNAVGDSAGADAASNCVIRVLQPANMGKGPCIVTWYFAAVDE